MRRYVTATFALLIREQWDPLAIAEINAVLIGPGGPLKWVLRPIHLGFADDEASVRDQKTPLSIFSHVADIYLSSLSAAIAASPSASDLPPVPLLALLQPITHALCYAPAKHIHALAQANALLPLLSACDAAAAAVSTAESAPVAKKRRTGAVDAAVARAFEPFDALLAAPLDLGEPDGAGVQSARAVKRAVLRGVFEAAARAETPDANRRRLYTVCQEQSDEPL
jgi:ribosomal RNA-processing protein 1